MNNNLTLYVLSTSLLLAGCAGIPTSGPTNKEIEEYNQQKDVSSKIQIIDVNQKLDSFWQNAPSFKVNQKLHYQFMNYLIRHSQINGNFYKRLDHVFNHAGIDWL